MHGSATTHENFTEEDPIQGSSDRVFGLVFCSAFAILAVFPLLHRKPLRVWALLVSATFLILGLLGPSILHPLNLLWTRFARLISKITTPLIMGLLFFVVFVPAALVARATGKVQLRVKSDPHAETYWVPKQPSGVAAESMHDQF